MGICFAYLGEFHDTRYRETVLSWMELFWTVGLIILPLSAWLIIPRNFTLMNHLPWKSWNYFVAAASLPSIMIGVALSYFPESPKFLIEAGEPTIALDILKDIFTQNTGRDVLEYPVRSLRETERQYSFLGKHRSIRSLSIRKKKDIRILLKIYWHQTKELCRPPHRTNTFLTCFIQFGIFASYYTLMLWIPDIFDKMTEFQRNHPNETVTVCSAMEETKKERESLGL